MTHPEPGELEPAFETYHQRFAVEFDYDVHFTRDAFRADNRLLLRVLDRKREDRRHRLFACIDSGVAEAQPELAGRIAAYFEAHREAAELVAPPAVLPGGEGAKLGWERARELMAAFGSHRLDRQSFVLAVGGGSFLDMVGFAAALVHRGLRLVRMPTTVLAQDDAGIGVKNALNDLGVKNFAGTFAPPFAVINDFSFLRTLSAEHWIGGVAEAFKVAIIKDARFFEFLLDAAPLLERRDEEAMEEVIRRCAVHHLRHIARSGDPFEMGSARPLDFGHWAAHKLESLSAYETGHGAAVAAGIALDSFYAARIGFIGSADLERIVAGLGTCGFRLWYPEMERRGPSGELALLAGIEEFRQHLGGRLTITLPRPLGNKVEVHELDPVIVEEGVAFLASFDKAAQRVPIQGRDNAPCAGITNSPRRHGDTEKMASC
jgi:3-dehydroquinate synthase